MGGKDGGSQSQDRGVVHETIRSFRHEILFLLFNAFYFVVYKIELPGMGVIAGFYCVLMGLIGAYKNIVCANIEMDQTDLITEESVQRVVSAMSRRINDGLKILRETMLWERKAQAETCIAVGICTVAAVYIPFAALIYVAANAIFVCIIVKERTAIDLPELILPHLEVATAALSQILEKVPRLEHLKRV